MFTLQSMPILQSNIITECHEVASILGNSETLDLTVMREFLKSDWEDFELSPKFNFTPKLRATKWGNVLCNLKNTFFPESGKFQLLAALLFG